MPRLTIVAVLVVVATGVIFLTLPGEPKDSSFEFGYQVMGTYARLVIVAPEHQTAEVGAESALSRIRAIEDWASTYKPYSEISRLSGLKPRVARVLWPEIYAVLDRSLFYSRLTGGAFDITVGPLMDLWRTAASDDNPPSKADIAGALESVGYSKIGLDPAKRTISLSQAGMSITLDAIVKGYAADQALEAIRRQGAQAGLVDLGGDIVCYGSPAGQDGWRVGIQNPFQPAQAPMDTSPGALLASIGLRDAAVATSGNYQRNFQIAGRAYSQIIDPRTGLPVEQAPSVTIIAPTAADADALATACSVLSVEEALKLINKIPHTEVLLITGSPEAPVFHTSSGFEKYLLSPLPD